MENQSQTAADFICYLYVEFYHLGVSLTYNSDSWCQCTGPAEDTSRHRPSRQLVS